MKLFLITAKNRTGSIETTNQLLTEACERVAVDCEVIDENQAFDRLPAMATGDALYRASVKTQARIIEQLLIQPSTVTFYQNYKQVFAPLNNVISGSILLEKAGLSIPRTIYGLPNNKTALKRAAEQLGLPLIIKAEGLSHSVGVMKIESLASLYSIADYLRLDSTKFVLREFIETESSARLIVLGDQVVDSIAYLNQGRDFRSNEGNQPQVEARDFSDEIEKTAIQAVKELGLEFGGVDIILDQKQNKHYLLEVNMPCFFGRAQLCTGQDIAEQMVRYLTKKAQNVSR